MTNKLTKEQEIKFILSVIINNYCAELSDSYGETWEDVEPQFINKLYKIVADEIASAKEEVLLGFIKWEFIDDGDTSRTDMLKEAKQYLEKLNND